MAGRGQHFIPQHFQEPFVIPNGKDQLWMFRRGVHEPVIVSRDDAAKQRDFYSPPSLDGIPTLDDLITDYEKELFSKVDTVRKISCGQPIPADLISEIAVHLVFRSAHLRKMLVETIDTFVENISIGLQSPEKFLFGENGLLSYECSPKFEKLLIKSIEDTKWYKFQMISSKTLARIGYLVLREKKKEWLDGAPEILDILQIDLFGDTKVFVAGTHKKILTKDFAPQTHIETLSQFDWQVVSHTETDAILPDCVCFGIDHDDDIQPLLLLDKQKTKMIILPLSPSTLAIGKRENTVFDSKTYNNLAVKASFDFYLSSEKKPKLMEHMLEIGGHMRTHLNLFTKNIITSHQSSFHTYDSLQKASHNINLIEQIQPKEGDKLSSLNLTFIDCAGKEDAEIVGQHVFKLVNQFLSPIVSSSFLDKIIFADDYNAALNDINQGFDMSGPQLFYDNKSSEGLAIPVAITKDGIYKIQIVVQGYVGNLFLSENKEDYNFALAVISYTLASVEFLYIQKEKFPDQILKPFKDPIENFLQSYTMNIFQDYYIASVMNHELETIEELEVNLVNIINQSFLDVTDKRHSYRTDNKLNKFFSFTVAQARDILTNFSKLFALLDLLKEERPLSCELTKILAKHDLDSWVLQFHQDIRTFYEDLSAWSDYKEIFFINRHLERWLLCFGVVIDLNKDGDIYLHIPFGSDTEYLQELIKNNDE